MHDVAIVVLSILVAVYLMRTDVLINILTSTQELKFLGSFIAGIFFTSIFTAAPATVTLGEIAQVNTLFGTAILGGLGAVVGDLIIFRFVKDRLSAHLVELLQEKKAFRRIRKIFKARLFRWSTFLLGGLVLASPLPDELGVSLLGAAKMSVARFALLSFLANSIGIFVVGIIARSLV